MTTAAGSGHVERIGQWWYLRRRESFSDASTGNHLQRQHRIKLGSTRTIRSLKAARTVADAYLARLAAPSLEAGAAVTFREYAERFVRDHVAMLRDASRRRYLSCISRLQETL